MGMTKCPDCHKEISEHANVCKHCGADLRVIAEETAQKLKDELKKKRARENSKIMIWVPLASTIAGLFLSFVKDWSVLGAIVAFYIIGLVIAYVIVSFNE